MSWPSWGVSCRLARLPAIPLLPLPSSPRGQAGAMPLRLLPEPCLGLERPQGSRSLPSRS